MQIVIDTKHLRQIFKACKHYLDLGGSLNHRAIQMSCSDGACTATALDGHKVVQVSVPYIRATGFTAPVLFLVEGGIPEIPKGADREAVIYATDNLVGVMLPGGAEWQLKKVATPYPSPEKMFADAPEPQLTMLASPKLLREGLKPFENEPSVKLEFGGPSGPIKITGENKRALVCAMAPRKEGP